MGIRMTFTLDPGRLLQPNLVKESWYEEGTERCEEISEV